MSSRRPQKLKTASRQFRVLEWGMMGTTGTVATTGNWIGNRLTK